MADNDAGNAANQYTVTLCTDPTEVVSGIVAGTYDVAACPLNMASVLYNKTNGNIQMLAINTLGTMYLLSTQELTDISELAGKTIISAGQGANLGAAIKALAAAGVKEVAVTELDIQQGTNGNDYVQVVNGCLGVCDRAPFCKLDADYHGDLTVEKLNDVLRRAIAGDGSWKDAHH